MDSGSGSLRIGEAGFSRCGFFERVSNEFHSIDA